MRGAALACLVALTGVASCSTPPPAFSSDDEAAVRALEEAYRAGWLANDSSAVMATLASDAVLMPAGREPLKGHAEIRGYWWPADGSLTTIHDYRIRIDEVEGSRDLAFLRGRGELAFTYQDASGQVSELSSRAVHLSVARRGPDGSWRIIRRAWSALGS